MRNKSPIHININNLSRIFGLKKVTTIVAPLLTISTSCPGDNATLDTPIIIASHDVNHASNISSTANGKAALLSDYNDMVMIDLGETINKGESYQITWKKKSGTNNNSKASLKVMESSSKSNFSPQQHLPQTNETKTFITSEFIASSNVRYIMIKVASPMDDAIEIYAINIYFSDTNSPDKNNDNKINTTEINIENYSFTPEDTNDDLNKKSELKENKTKGMSKSHTSLTPPGNKTRTPKLHSLHCIIPNVLFFNNSREFKIVGFNLNKRGAPPEEDSKRWTYSKLEIKPPPI